MPTKLKMLNSGFNQPTLLLYPVTLPLFSFRRAHCVWDFSVLWLALTTISVVNLNYVFETISGTTTVILSIETKSYAKNLGSWKSQKLSILGKYSKYLTVFNK